MPTHTQAPSQNPNSQTTAPNSSATIRVNTAPPKKEAIPKQHLSIHIDTGTGSQVIPYTVREAQLLFLMGFTPVVGAVTGMGMGPGVSVKTEERRGRRRGIELARSAVAGLG
ncbi:hypothetical protein CC80DRAFT_507313 [Byssothecium circinans]|uniref:Uncharacterized protein n=1 Tax=Byssothecium circinans TaxID=147558 RepID=A0A6A5TP05_9PLEO|nr:hypothetical protein CC80DRAFT_507313 [Byssothecium circinans]